MTENDKPNSIVDTTDCFEAISTFKSTKNFLFLIILLTLLTLQTFFWMNRFGLIDGEFCQSDTCAYQSCQLSDKCENCDNTLAPPLPPTTDDSVQADLETDNIDDSEIIEQAQKQIEQNETQLTTETDDQQAQEQAVDTENEKSQIKLLSKMKPSPCLVACIIKICNFLLIFASVLYSLILLMSIKVSITGRMGGITHISKAFIFSLYAIMFLLPWQQLFPNILVGAMYTPVELYGWNISQDTSIPMTILFYLRFTGLWLVVFLMFFCAQLRSRKWTKTILRRLGMLY